jgi:two-component SAPR family response regulator
MGDNNTIWIIDDDQIAVAIVSHLIEQHQGLRLLQTFENAKEALKALQQPGEKPDLIMLDLNMPMMNGWDLLEEMKKMKTVDSVSVVVFTSSIDERDRKRSGNYSSVIGHFVKPMTREMLKDILSRIS